MPQNTPKATQEFAKSSLKDHINAASLQKETILGAVHGFQTPGSQ